MSLRLNNMVVLLIDLSPEALLAKKKKARQEFEAKCFRAEIMVPEEYLRQWWKGTG